MADVTLIGSKYSLLASHGDVEVDKAIETISFSAGVNVIDVKLINESAKNGLLYLDKRGVPLNTATDEDEKTAFYKIVPIGYNNKLTGRELCASFMKNKNSWDGVFINTVDSLIERAMNVYEEKGGKLGSERDIIEQLKGDIKLIGFGLDEVLKNNFELAKDQSILGVDAIDKLTQLKLEIKNNENTYDTVYEEIYSRLLFKENWKTKNKNRLFLYIKALLDKIAYDQSNNDSLVGNGYILSHDKTMCVFNTGLLDIYNNDIYLLDKTNNERDINKKDLSVVTSKVLLYNLGFDRELIKHMPKPIKFYTDKSELVFNGSIEDFDLEDNFRLKHIIDERRERFPRKFRELSADVLGEYIKSAIKKAVRMAERDYKYVVPMYNFKLGKIQYLMPLHIEKSIDEAPELVLVIGEESGFYAVYTILTPDDAYDNARLLGSPSTTWLQSIVE